LNPGRHSRFGGCWGKLVPGALSLPQPVKRQVNGTSHAWIVEWLRAGIDNHLVRPRGPSWPQLRRRPRAIRGWNPLYI